MKNEMNRKEFLRLVFLGLAAGAGGSLLASCGSKEETSQTETSGGAQKTPSRPAAADPCADVTGLTDAELTMRNETLKYIPVSADPDKRCDNCKFWKPSESGEFCGSCELIKGPINPKGYCVSWFTRET